MPTGQFIRCPYVRCTSTHRPPSICIHHIKFAILGSFVDREPFLVGQAEKRRRMKEMMNKKIIIINKHKNGKIMKSLRLKSRRKRHYHNHNYYFDKWIAMKYYKWDILRNKYESNEVKTKAENEIKANKRFTRQYKIWLEWIWSSSSFLVPRNGWCFVFDMNQ